MNREIINISGVSESRSLPIISKLINEKEGQSLIITASSTRSERLALDLSFFSNKKIVVLPPEEEIFINYSAKNNDFLLKRVKALKDIDKEDDLVVIAPVTAAIKKLMPRNIYSERKIRIELGKEIDLEQVKEALIEDGYERWELVEAPGQFSIRGGILDVFTPDNDYPYRIELFGTEVDSIRTFDPWTQRSVENIKYVEILPFHELIFDEKVFDKAVEKIKEAYGRQMDKIRSGDREDKVYILENLQEKRDELIDQVRTRRNLQYLDNYLNYFYDDSQYLWQYMKEPLLIVDDPIRTYEHLELREQELLSQLDIGITRGKNIPEDSFAITSREDFLKIYDEDLVYVLTPFKVDIPGITKVARSVEINAKQMITFGGRMASLSKEIRDYLDKGYKVTILCSTRERFDNLKVFLEEEGLETKVILQEGYLSSGFVYPDEKFCYISDLDIFSSFKSKGRRKHKSKSKAIESFVELKKGDYVVHENYGIGKFLGIEEVTSDGETKDYISIEYGGKEKLYVPVEQMDVVEKYIGSEGNAPKLSRLSSGEWKLAKAKAKVAAQEIAEELLKIQANRQLTKGFAFEKDSQMQKDFEDDFPYVETDDQLRCAEEIKKDMEKDISMDRLLCGDVGFGKTEVAMRAMFKCVDSGKQCLVLVPTTILANQHYHTIRERFKDYPVNVEMLCRFRTEKQQKEIIEKVEKGSIEILVGTHRVLSDDVKFKDLGLMIIDEEQRFGVVQKEKIKKMKANVDLLTLSATPIPRTLNMSLSGIKDMSLIEEPPEERYPVQTFVLNEDDYAIREIIHREIDRDGQVFVVFNRINGIKKVAERIQKLVPDGKIAIGHGRMNEHALEDVMFSFINGDYNILVATTIIESGIDIPNANTMIILDADKYGLSQLYQLRGRVGRGNKMAYAYLMYKKDKVLSEDAEKRLKAIKEFTEFGSGFKIAMRDLEIRGAGNLLGSHQSGHIMSVGYELYCKLLDEAIRQARGEIRNIQDREIPVEIKVFGNIPRWYIQSDTLKLQMYKKIATIKTRADMEELIDEALDRYGDLPKEMLNLIKISRIRHLAAESGLSRLYQQDNYIYFTYSKGATIPIYNLGLLAENFGQKAFIHLGERPYIKLLIKEVDKLDNCIKALELLTEQEGEENVI